MPINETAWVIVSEDGEVRLYSIESNEANAWHSFLSAQASRRTAEEWEGRGYRAVQVQITALNPAEPLPAGTVGEVCETDL